MKQKRIGAAYSRVSDSESAAKEGGSLENQEFMGQEIAKMLSIQKAIEHSIEYILTEEEGISGGTTNRPEYQKLLQLIATKKIDFVVAKEISRLSRSTKDFCEFMEHCKKNSVSVHIRGLDVDFNTPFGELIYKLLALIAEFERKLGQERTRSGIRSGMIHNAKLPGGPAILGFDRDPEHKARWLPNQSELKIVDRILEAATQHDSLPNVCRALKVEGIKNKSGEYFRPDSLRRLIFNRKYEGILEVNIGTPQEPKIQEVQLPFGCVVDIQKLSAARIAVSELGKRFGYRTRTKTRNYLLTGLLETNDGTTFHGFYGKSRTGHRIYYYGLKQWKNFSLPADELEKKVIATLRCYESEREFQAHVSKVLKSHTFKIDFYKQRTTAIEGQLGKMAEKEKKIIDSVMEANGRSSELTDTLQNHLKELQREKKELETALSRLKRDLQALLQFQPDTRDIKATLEHTFNNFQKAAPSEQRALLRGVFERLVVGKDYTVQVFWKNPSESVCDTGGEEFELQSKWGG